MSWRRYVAGGLASGEDDMAVADVPAAVLVPGQVDSPCELLLLHGAALLEEVLESVLVRFVAEAVHEYRALELVFTSFHLKYFVGSNSS